MGKLADPLRAQREQLIALLEDLTDDEWAVSSLCEGWRVGDVAGHLAVAPSTGVFPAMVGFARHGFSLNRFIAESAKDYARRGREAILVQLRTNAQDDKRPVGMSETAALADAVCHAHDIGYPLGKPLDVDATSYEVVADFFADLRGPLAWPFRGDTVRSTARGVRLVAEDVDWSRGDGLDVHASASALLRLLAGRAVDPDELTGPGAGPLKSALAE